MNNKNKKYLIIAIFTIAIIFFGGTLAYWQWETNTGQQTSVTFTVENNFKCSVDGGGDITSSNITLAPSTCTNSKYAIKRTITTNTEITGSNMSVLMDLWLDVNSIDPELKNSTNFKYAITTNPNSCTDGYINGGTLSGTKAQLLDDKIYLNTKSDTYYLYIWLDSAETNPNTQNKTFSLSLNGSCTSAPSAEPDTPVLETGMIPITLSATGAATTVSPTDSSWYSYSNKEWANAVLVSSTNRANYYESDGVTIKSNQPVADSDILAYYVWIPKYSYKMNSESGKGNESLISISFEETTPEGYTAHPAFTFNGGIDGFWVGKFETSHSTLASSPYIDPELDYDTPPYDANNLSCTNNSCKNSFGLIIKPNVLSLKFNNISNIFYASRAMSSTGNPYGLDATKTDTHMMKNSEWGAVAYLSHSVYGIGEEIYINNSEDYYTGRSGGNVGGGVNSLSEQFGSGSTSTQYNTYGYYTWIGQAINSSGIIGAISDATLGTNASTTGNVTGVYDMSGGTYEYVMGNYNNTIKTSGFSTLPDNKYYDLYTITENSSCDESTCGGHALYETASWYGDATYFVNSSNPWFFRGGDYNDGADAGAFYSSNYNGSTLMNSYIEISNYGFRLVATKGA